MPERASGLAVSRDRPDSAGRKVGRIALWPVRAVWTAVWALPRVTMWAYDRYQVGDRVKGIFFNETETIGVFPTALIETGFGLNVGARVFFRDLFGKDAELRGRIGYGGRLRQIYALSFESGQLLGDRVSFELTGAYEIFPKSRFFGIGNGDAQTYQPMQPLIDPLSDDTAIGTRFYHDDVVGELAVSTRLSTEWTVKATGSYRWRDFDRFEHDDADEPGDDEFDDDRDIGLSYDTSRLVGYDTGLSNLFGELELIWDTRRVSRYFLSTAAPSTGWKVGGFAGYQQGLGDDPSSHGRFGLDVQRHFDLYGGDRVLMLRAYGEGVTGGLDEVPFVDLPRLGGPYFLRGYQRDRFRDRDVTLVTAEYDWSLDRNISAYVFVDAGRVWRNLGDIDWDGLEDTRMGFGGGLQVHSMTSFIARVLVASSIDGGFYLNFSLDPVFDTRSRRERP